MTGRSRAHRAGFTVRCACGNEYHSDDAHIGRRIRCRCGRTVTIERPAGDASSGDIDPDRSAEGSTKTRQRRRRSRTWRQTFASWRAQRSRSMGSAMAHAFTLALRDIVHPKRSRRYVTRFTWLVFALMLVTWLVLVNFSEHFLPATMLAYGPRSVVLVPILLLLPWILLSARRALLPWFLSAWVTLVPIMGVRFSPTTLARGLPAQPASGNIRVLTFNVLVGNHLVRHLPRFLDKHNPQVVAFQECGEQLWQSLRTLDGWFAHRSDALCTMSRWPLTPIDSMRRPPGTSRSRGLLGGYGSLARYRIDTPSGPLIFVNLHLPTARYGLQSLMRDGEGVLPADPLDAIGTAARTATGTVSPDVDAQLRSSRLARDLASERASIHASSGDASIPLIVAGDFNLPVESTIYRRHWTHLTNAFESVGNGLGWTKREGKLLRIRIDHVLMNDATLTPVRAILGDDWGSDHLPVVVDVRRVR